MEQEDAPTLDECPDEHHLSDCCGAPINYTGGEDRCTECGDECTVYEEASMEAWEQELQRSDG